MIFYPGFNIVGLTHNIEQRSNIHSRFCRQENNWSNKGNVFWRKVSSYRILRNIDLTNFWWKRQPIFALCVCMKYILIIRDGMCSRPESDTRVFPVWFGYMRNLSPFRVITGQIRIISEKPRQLYGQPWLLIELSFQPMFRTQYVRMCSAFWYFKLRWVVNN